MRYLKLIFGLVAISSLLSVSFGLDFVYQLSPSQTYCFYEDLAEGTLVLAEIETDPIELKATLEISGIDGNIIAKSHTQVSHTPFENGVYRFCLHNPNHQHLMVDFSLNSGSAAKNYSSFAQKKDFKPIELDIRMVEDLLEIMKSQLSAIVEKEDEKMAETDRMSSTLIIFSVVTAICVLIVSCIQVRYLKRYFQRRKMI